MVYITLHEWQFTNSDNGKLMHCTWLKRGKLELQFISTNRVKNSNEYYSLVCTCSICWFHWCDATFHGNHWIWSPKFNFWLHDHRYLQKGSRITDCKHGIIVVPWIIKEIVVSSYMYVCRINFLCVHVFRRGNLRLATLLFLYIRIWVLVGALLHIIMVMGP